MKKLLLLTALILCIATGVGAEPLYTSSSEEIMTSGVTLKNEKRFYGDYALNITLVSADLRNENLRLELLKNSGGCDKTDTVMNFAKGNENTVAAINGDFFSSYKNGQNFSLGIEVKDGELLQSHINSNMAAGFLNENVLSLSYVDFSAEVEAPDGTKMPVAHINKPTDYYGAVLMYTPGYNGGTSPFLPVGITVLTVEEDKVKAKGISQGGTVRIPENGYILVIDDNMTPFLEYKFSEGDSVTISVKVTPSLDEVSAAFGGGTLLLKDGEKTAITHDVSGNNPRSVIGTNKDGTEVYLLTVDGRKATSRGVTLSELSDICKEMGMVNAINLDGGGSTALAGKTLENRELRHLNTPTENRKVINAVGITSSAKSGETAGFLCSAEKECVLSGDSVKLSFTAYDNNFNAPIKSASPEWSVPKGKGYVKDNVYYAEGSGEVTISVKYKGKVTDACTVTVIDEVSGIIAPEEYELDFGIDVPLSGKVTVFDEKGNTTTVSDINLLNPRYDRKLITFMGGTIRLMKEGAGLLTLSHSGAERSIKLTSGKFDTDSKAPITTDALNRKGLEGFTFNVFSSSEMNTLFDRIVYAHAMDVLAKADESAVTGGDKPKDLTPQKAPITAGEFVEKSYDYAKIISMKLQDGTVSRGDQWQKLAAALKAPQKNVFVILDKKPSFVMGIDRDAFYGMLKEAAKSKNVFVIYSGDENFCRIENGVRYITIANVRDEDMLHKAIENTCYLSFSVTKDSASYAFRKLYE